MLPDPVCVYQTDKIAHVDLMMVRKSIGGCPVLSRENNQLVGIITQRDIMLSRFSVSVGGMTVQDLMTSPAISCARDTSLREILKIMFEKSVERLPVVDDQNHLVGLIVHDRILNALYKALPE